MKFRLRRAEELFQIMYDPELDLGPGEKKFALKDIIEGIGEIQTQILC